MKPKTTIILGLILIILAGTGMYFTAEPTEDVTNPNTEAEIDTSDWVTYRNEELGFEVKHPEGWEIDISDEGDVKHVSFISKDFRFPLRRIHRSSLGEYGLEGYVKNVIGEQKKNFGEMIKLDMEEYRQGEMTGYRVKKEYKHPDALGVPIWDNYFAQGNLVWLIEITQRDFDKFPEDRIFMSVVETLKFLN